MAWVLTPAPEPVMKFLSQGGLVRWNNTTHSLMGYPERVDVMYDAENNHIGFRLGGEYIVTYSDDELRYEAVITPALEYIGVQFQEDYQATPQLVNHEEGEIAGMVGAIYMPLPE